MLPGRKNNCRVGKLTEGIRRGAYLNKSCTRFHYWSFAQNVARDFRFGIIPAFPPIRGVLVRRRNQ